MNAKNTNEAVSKSHRKAVEKLNNELKEWAKEQGRTADQEWAEVAEDADTYYYIKDFRLEGAELVYMQASNEYGKNATEERCTIAKWDDDWEEWYEVESWGWCLMEYVSNFRKWMRKAKKYWSMSSEQLDAISEGKADDIEDE